MATQPLKIISMPRLLTVGWSKKILSLCEEAARHNGPVSFDFREVTWAAPFGLTVTSVALAHCLATRKRVYYTPPNTQVVREYLERIGFDQTFLTGGHPARHVPTSVELRKLLEVDRSVTDALIDLIDSQIDLSSEDEFQMRLHIQELMTNGFDHSRSPVGCYVCAQWYQQNRNLRISFADGGIGILESLNRSRKYGRFSTDADAILKATEPGVTTRIGRPGGMGLTYIKDYVRRNRGVLTIIGGHSKVIFYWNKTEVRKHDSKFQGTIVDIRIRPGKRLQTSRAVEEDSIF